jgi:hypothetical protein
MSKDEAAIDAEIKSKGLNAPRLTPSHIDEQIVGEAYHVFPGTALTVCALTLKNGFHVTGESASASPENFDAEIGRKIARDNARNKIWAFEGYALRNKLAGAAKSAALLCAFAIAFAFLSPAFADDAVSASIPIDQWVTAILTWVRDFLVAIASLAVARFAPAFVKQFLTNEVLTKAVDYAIAATEGAAKGAVLTLPQARGVLFEAEKYAIANAPALAKRLGTSLRPMILSRISAAGGIQAEANASMIGAPIQ